MQEWIALTLVVTAALIVTGKVTGKILKVLVARPLAKYLLKRGHVKQAMRIHSWTTR